MFILIHMFQHLSMKEFNLSNQTEQCVTWINNHVFENTQLHLDKNRYENIYKNMVILIFCILLIQYPPF